MAGKPFIYLSAGVSNAAFTESLSMAAEAGTDYSGVLCGRATWKEGIPVYAKQGAKGLEEWLQREGVRNINAVNDAIRTATPWYVKYRLWAWPPPERPPLPGPTALRRLHPLRAAAWSPQSSRGVPAGRLRLADS
jgi:hypothetical protein